LKEHLFNSQKNTGSSIATGYTNAKSETEIGEVGVRVAVFPVPGEMKMILILKINLTFWNDN
jgi:hypothetical protein